METLPIRAERTNLGTISDVAFRILCALNGLLFRLSRSRSKRVLSFAMWFALFVPWFSWLYFFVYLRAFTGNERVPIIRIVAAPNVIVHSIACLYWRLLFILRNHDFELVLQERGRCFRDVAVPSFSVALNVVMYIHRFITVTQYSLRILVASNSVFNLNMMIFLVVYDDAINNLLKTQVSLNSWTQATSSMDMIEILSLRDRIRKSIKKVNKLFALPLAVFCSQMLMVVLYIFTEWLGHGFTSREALLVVCGVYFIFQFFLLARKGSNLVANCTKLEYDVRKRITDCSSPNVAHFLHRLRFREEWDTLQVGCFALGIPNLLKFLLFCVTCAAVVLQFDHRVVTTVNRLSSL